MAGEANLDLFDHLGRIPHRVELVQRQRQAVPDHVHDRGHLHDVEVHADVHGLAWPDALAGAAFGTVKGVVDDTRIVFEASLVFLPERPRVHFSASGFQLLSRDVSALQ
ncbi:hypothetical protein D3C77_457150 [compost metagenome]